MTTLLRRIPPLALLVLALAACAGEDASFRAPDDDSTSVSPSPSEEPIGSPTSPVLVEPRDGLKNVRAHDWESAKSIDESTVELTFWHGVEECYGVDRVDVAYEERRIVLTLYTGDVPGDRACIQVAVQKAVRVTLEEPIGGRELVDGAETSK